MPYEYHLDESADSWSETETASGMDTATLAANTTEWVLFALMMAAFIALVTCIAIVPIACAYVAAALYLCWITVEAGRAFWRNIRASRSLGSAIGDALEAALETAFLPILLPCVPAVWAPLLFLWMLIAAIRWVVT